MVISSATPVPAVERPSNLFVAMLVVTTGLAGSVLSMEMGATPVTVPVPPPEARQAKPSHTDRAEFVVSYQNSPTLLPGEPTAVMLGAEGPTAAGPTLTTLLAQSRKKSPVLKVLAFSANSPGTSEDARGRLLATDDFLSVIVTVISSR